MLDGDEIQETARNKIGNMHWKRERDKHKREKERWRDRECRISPANKRGWGPGTWDLGPGTSIEKKLEDIEVAVLLW